MRNLGYKEKFRYDANGNILTLLRRGANVTGMQLAMDNLKYFYYYTNTSNARAEYDPTVALPGNVKSLSNQLARVTDSDPAGNYSDDIDNQAAGNYDYDNIGNLIKDVKDSITNTEWTVYGKIKQIIKSSGITIKYNYDASGNRVSKLVSIGSSNTRDFYIRDVQGNVMAMYKDKTSHVEWSEQHLYGSSRLGIWNYGKQVPLLPVGVGYDSMMVGSFNYELTNHLGNVLSTISDKKVGVSVGGVTVDYYNAEVMTQNDYYAAGMLMPDRTFQAGNGLYRYSINGQEKSNEIAPNTTTAKFWEYDSRIVRRWNRDPLPVFGISEYATFNNNPIWMTDALGDSSIFGTKGEKIHYDKKDKDLRVFMKDGDKLTLIGSFGGKINVDGILKNLLQSSRSEMANGRSPKLSWFESVLPGNRWDLKANQKTIFGVAWEFDAGNEQKTGFSFNYNNTLNLEFSNAADVGNFHAGYTGTYANIPFSIQRMFAGGGEKIKNAVDMDGKNFSGNSIIGPPFGDRKPDYFWNKMGMVSANYDKKINAVITPKPVYNIPPTYIDALKVKTATLPLIINK